MSPRNHNRLKQIAADNLVKGRKQKVNRGWEVRSYKAKQVPIGGLEEIGAHGNVLFASSGQGELNMANVPDSYSREDHAHPQSVANILAKPHT